ncbi:MAG: DMT family transporter [Syntrophomonadaceae bacterium]|nr:DMT family transporter [Syntrophomonadaceae bacterium]
MRPALIYLALFIAVLSMSTSSIMIRYITAPALIIALYRVIFTAGLAGILSSAAPARVGELKSRDLGYILAAGLFLALHLGLWITSLNYTSISSSVLFTNLQVIFVLLLSAWLLQESVNRWVQGGIFLALLGSLLIVQGDLQSGRLLGDMLALLSGLSIALYFLVGRDVRSRVDVWTYTSLASVAAAVVLLVACLALGVSLTGYPRLDWILFLLQAAVPGIIGHATLNWALKYVKAPVVSVSVLGESVGASVLAYLILGETLAWNQLAGGLLILSGIFIAAGLEHGPAGEAVVTSLPPA